MYYGKVLSLFVKPIYVIVFSHCVAYFPLFSWKGTTYLREYFENRNPTNE